MKDKDFLQWIHDRLEHVHEEERNMDYMFKLRSIIQSYDPDKVTPDNPPLDTES